jgi:hypothetical protein
MIRHRTKKTIDLPRALAHVGIDRSRFNYLFQQGRSDETVILVLQTEYSEPIGGAARRISRENLLELNFIDAATECGFNLLAASYLSKRWLADLKKGALKNWYVRAGEAHESYFSESTTKASDGNESLSSLSIELCEVSARVGTAAIDAHLPNAASYLRAINLHEIVRRADGLLSVFGEDTQWIPQ